jgi:hypothetical protein
MLSRANVGAAPRRGSSLIVRQESSATQKMNTTIFRSLIMLCLVCSGLASERSYQNLGNPTAYVFSASREKVLGILRAVRGPNSWGPLAGSYYEEEGVYGFGLFDIYTERYWNGRIERREDIDPPEAGRIGTIQVHFRAQLISKGPDQTLVSVTVDSFEQQVDRHYRIFPHFQKVPKFVKVKSDTYYEYFFLRKLGDLLGEKGMAPINGKP